jgi:hypothetical protein
MLRSDQIWVFEKPFSAFIVGKKRFYHRHACTRFFVTPLRYSDHNTAGAGDASERLMGAPRAEMRARMKHRGSPVLLNTPFTRPRLITRRNKERQQPRAACVDAIMLPPVAIHG